MKNGFLLILFGLLFTLQANSQGQHKVRNSFLPNQQHNNRGSGSFLYTLTTLNEPYNNLTGATSINNGEAWDDPTYVVPIAFPFELNGNAITYLQFMGSGSLLASPTADPNWFTVVFPFEMDLIDRGYDIDVSQSPISYKVEGATGSRILKIEWKNAGSYEEYVENGTLDMYINFQLWLYEGSNRVEIRFGESMIDDPFLFYYTFGVIMGVVDIDQDGEQFTNAHFLVGDIDAPVLSSTDVTIEGTPAEGTVYRLSLDIPVEVTVSGQNSTSNCDPNGTATAEASEGAAPYTYDWNNGETTSTITGLDAGTYTVTVSDANGSTATGSVTITNVGPVNPNAFATDETSLDADDGTATSAAFGGSAPYDYAWSNGEDTQQIINLSPGIYTVTVTDVEGCSATQSVTVNAFGCPELLIEAGLSDASCFGTCDGSIQVLDVFQGTAPFNYQWSNGDSSDGITDLCAGDYSVTVIDAVGCSVDATYTLSQPNELLANAGSTDETAENANDGTAWALPTGGSIPYTYAWSNSSTESMITGLAPGSYTVTVTDFNACTATQTVEVDSFSCLLVADILDVSCFGNCDGSISANLINSAGLVTYLWSTGATTPSITGLCPGAYTITATDEEGCIAIETYAIEEPSQLLSNIGSTGETGPLANDGTAWAAPTGGTPPYIYEWNTGSTDSLITGLAPGIYGVIVTDAHACADTQFVFVEQFPCVGTISSAFTNPDCFNACNGDATVSITGGIGPFSYEWSNGETTSTISNLCPGDYDVTLTDEGQNCLAELTFQIEAPDSIGVTVDQIIHFNDITAGIIEVTVSGGTLPYTYSWTGPNGFASNAEDLNGLVPGFYTLVVTDANGCVLTSGAIEIRDETVSTNTLITVDVRIYPNPAKDQVYIDIDDITGFSIVIRSIDGRVISAWKEEKTLDISSVPVGLYFLEGVSGKELFRQRLVVAR